MVIALHGRATSLRLLSEDPPRIPKMEHFRHALAVPSAPSPESVSDIQPLQEAEVFAEHPPESARYPGMAPGEYNVYPDHVCSATSRQWSFPSRNWPRPARS